MRLSLASLLVVLGACGSQVDMDERDTETTTAAAPRPTGPAPVVVAELFTSQGCSSCPPADRLLSEIGELAGEVDVIPLAFHVDYWDDLGWRDPFAAAAWTARQRRYAAAISRGRVYTPMLVVQGREHMVGSSRDEVSAAIRGAARAGSTGAAIAGRGDGRDRIAVDATAGGSPSTVFIALVESGIETEVARGENAGRRLRNDFIVRRLMPAFDLAAGERKTETVAVAIDSAWRRDNLAAVLLLQDPETFAIHAAARATVGP